MRLLNATPMLVGILLVLCGARAHAAGQGTAFPMASRAVSAPGEATRTLRGAQARSVNAATSALDPTFGSGGIVQANIEPRHNTRGWATLVKTDGSILVGAMDELQHTLLTRFTPNGRLDRGYGGVGVVKDALSVSDMALEPDGRLLVALNGWTPGWEGAVSRYNADGSPDLLFGVAGTVTIPGDTTVWGVASQTDGGVLVAGYEAVPGNDHWSLRVWRYTPDGQPDLSFGSGGSTTGFDHGGEARDIVVQPDGKILVGGLLGDLEYTGWGTLTVVRFNVDGSIDPGFGRDGAVSIKIDPMSTQERCEQLALQPDGRILVVGGSIPDPGSYTSERTVLLRLNTDGSLDSSFGNGGQRMIEANPDSSAGGGFIDQRIALRPDGRVWVGQTMVPNEGIYSGCSIHLQRLLPDGTSDSSFGSDGAITTHLPATNNTFFGSMALQPDGRLVVTGGANYGNIQYGHTYVLVARYLAE